MTAAFQLLEYQLDVYLADASCGYVDCVLYFEYYKRRLYSLKLEQFVGGFGRGDIVADLALTVRDGYKAPRRTCAFPCSF